MLKKSTNVLAAIAVILALSADLYGGGGKRNGTSGAQELLIPVAAKGLAMSGAYTSGITGLDAIFYNPAGLGVTEYSAEAMFSYMNYIADIGFTFAAAAVHFEEFGSLGFSVRNVAFGDIPVTTVQNPYGTGATFSPTYVVVGVTYANALTDRIRVGINVNVISEQIQRVSASGVAFDAGVQYNGVAGVEGLKFGVVVKNLGPEMKFSGPDLLRTAEEIGTSRGTQFYAIDAASFQLPTQLELGLAYQARFSDLYSATFASAYQNNSFSHDEYRFAGEFNFDELLFLRAGYTYVTEFTDSDDEYLFGPTFGAGVNVDAGLMITVDYAYRYARLFDSNHMVSVSLGF
jgi:hypothetical protein